MPETTEILFQHFEGVKSKKPHQEKSFVVRFGPKFFWFQIALGWCFLLVYLIYYLFSDSTFNWPLMATFSVLGVLLTHSSFFKKRLKGTIYINEEYIGNHKIKIKYQNIESVKLVSAVRSNASKRHTYSLFKIQAGTNFLQFEGDELSLKKDQILDIILHNWYLSTSHFDSH